MSSEPRWINRQALLLKHAESLRLFGGAEGLRDEGMLDSALMRAVNAWSYGKEERLPHLAAAYAFGLSRNHPFVDGNKRVAFIAYIAFLKLNGYDLIAPQPDAYQTMIALTAGGMTEEAFGLWIEAHIRPRTKS
jgi:death on curing protein